MKSYFVAFITSFFLMFGTASQAALSTDGLSETQKAELALQLAKMKEQGGPESSTVDGAIDTLSKIGSLGKETGIAVREGLNAVVDVADKFSGTPVGLITIGLIIWNVVGSDLMLIVLGLFSMWMGWRIFQRLVLPRKVVREYENVPVLWGLFTRKVPIKLEEAPRETEEMRATGVIAIMVGALIMVVSIANI